MKHALRDLYTQHNRMNSNDCEMFKGLPVQNYHFVTLYTQTPNKEFVCDVENA